MVGTVHKDYLQAANQATEILIRVGDNSTAFNNTLDTIALAVQLRGFDNIDTLRCHVQLSSLYHVKKDYISAVNHMLAAKYLVELLGGAHHPEIINIFTKIGSLYCEIGGWDIGWKCMEEAKKRTEITDPIKHCEISVDLADMMARWNMFGAAAELQKHAYTLTRFYSGAKHEKTTDVKRTLELYLRADMEYKKYQHVYKLEQDKLRIEEEMKIAENEKKAKAEHIRNSLLENDEKASKKSGKSGKQGNSKHSHGKTHKKK